MLLAGDTDTLVATPDLVLLKDDGLVSVVAGQSVTYTLSFRNDGTQAATGVTLSDTLPLNTTFVSASDGGTFAAGVVTWTIGNVPVGTLLTRTVTVQVNDPLPAGVTSITNLATATDDGRRAARAASAPGVAARASPVANPDPRPPPI